MTTRIRPTTTTLSKSSVQTEPHALTTSHLQQEIPNIQTLLLHLEGKGRSENTLIAYEKNLKALAIRADLKDTKAVELTIARYKKKNGRPITNNYKSNYVTTTLHTANSIKSNGKSQHTLPNPQPYNHQLKRKYKC